MKESREIIQKPLNEPVELDRHFEPQIVPSGRYPSYREGYAAEGFQLLDYWKAIRKRLWLVAGIAVLVTTLTAIYMARKPNIYAATARIQVDLEQPNPDLVTDDRRRPLANPDPSYFNTQLQLLDSESLLRQVVKEHSLDTNKEFLTAKNEGTGIVRGMLRAVGLASDAKKDSANEDYSFASNSTLVSSDEIAEAVRLAPYVDIIRKNMGVEPVRESRATVKDTRLIEISFRHTNPQLAAFVVNSIGETFVTANQNKRSGTNRKTSDFLQKRITDLQSEIRSDELELSELQKNIGILKTDGEQTIVIDRLAGLNKQLLEAENKRKNAEAQYVAIKDSPEAINALAEAENQRIIQDRELAILSVRNETQKKIADFRSQRAKLLEEYKESAPEIVEIDTQIRSLEGSLTKLVEDNTQKIQVLKERTAKLLVDNLRTKYVQAKNEEDQIRAAYDKQYNEAQVQNSGAVRLKLLEQTIETNRGFLDNIRKQQSSNDVASQGSDNNISVEGFAIPPEQPVSPSRVMTVMAALFLSTLFGMGLALFLEYLDDTIRTTEEIETYLQLPALAAIPTIDSIPKRRLLLVGASGEDGEEPPNSELLIYADSRSSLSEAYRQLRTSILLSTAGHAPKSLLITSSLPSEGKTTTATNTAISLAQTGAKVLIIDADMRRPRLHSVFNIENGDGLSTILSTELSETDILNVIKHDEGTKLNMLTSGPIPPNPAELIGSEQMANLLKLLSQHFTHVVVDSPPITSFTDGVLIASMVDGVILVVHAGKSSRQVVRRARQLLQDVGAKIFGVVLNNVNLSSQDNYYYYQSYYHRSNYRPSDDQ